MLLSTAGPVVASMLSECPLIASACHGSLHLDKLGAVSQEGEVVLNVFVVPLKVNG